MPVLNRVSFASIRCRLDRKALVLNQVSKLNPEIRCFEKLRKPAFVPEHAFGADDSLTTLARWRNNAVLGDGITLQRGGGITAKWVPE